MGCSTYLDGKQIRAHRFVYELLRGPIADGLTLDHLCHTSDVTCVKKRCEHRRCVNPDHLEPCSQSVNTLRGHGVKTQRAKTHCPHGHPLDGTRSNGYRYCKTCAAAHVAAWRARQPKKGKANLGKHHADKTHCPHGHPYDAENTYVPPSGVGRYCKECSRIQGRQKSAKISEARRAAKEAGS